MKLLNLIDDNEFIDFYQLLHIHPIRNYLSNYYVTKMYHKQSNRVTSATLDSIDFLKSLTGYSYSKINTREFPINNSNYFFLTIFKESVTNKFGQIDPIEIEKELKRTQLAYHKYLTKLDLAHETLTNPYEKELYILNYKNFFIDQKIKLIIKELELIFMTILKVYPKENWQLDQLFNNELDRIMLIFSQLKKQYSTKLIESEYKIFNSPELYIKDFINPISHNNIEKRLKIHFPKKTYEKLDSTLIRLFIFLKNKEESIYNKMDQVANVIGEKTYTLKQDIISKR